MKNGKLTDVCALPVTEDDPPTSAEQYLLALAANLTPEQLDQVPVTFNLEVMARTMDAMQPIVAVS